MKLSKSQVEKFLALKCGSAGWSEGFYRPLVQAVLEGIHEHFPSHRQKVREVWAKARSRGYLTFGPYKGLHLDECPPDYVAGLLSNKDVEPVVKEQAALSLSHSYLKPEEATFPITKGRKWEWRSKSRRFPRVREIDSYVLQWYAGRAGGEVLKVLCRRALEVRPPSEEELRKDERAESRAEEPVFGPGVPDEVKAFYPSESVCNHFREGDRVYGVRPTGEVTEEHSKPSGWYLTKDPDVRFQDEMIDQGYRDRGQADLLRKFRHWLPCKVIREDGASKERSFLFRKPDSPKGLKVEVIKHVEKDYQVGPFGLSTWHLSSEDRVEVPIFADRRGLRLPPRHVTRGRLDRKGTLYFWDKKARQVRVRATEFSWNYTQFTEDEEGRKTYRVPERKVKDVEVWEYLLEAMDRMEGSPDLEELDLRYQVVLNYLKQLARVDEESAREMGVLAHRDYERRFDTL